MTDLRNSLEPLAREIEYKGLLIVLTEFYMFDVSWPEDAGREQAYAFRSLADAKEAIDKYFTAMEKSRRVSKRIALPALNGAGEPVTIKGIHGTRNTLLTDPSGNDGLLYPRVDWIADVFKERGRLQKRIEEINRKVDGLAIGGYGGRYYGAPDRIDSELERLERDVRAKTLQAEGKGK